MSAFRNEMGKIGSMAGMTPSVKFLLIINILMFLLGAVFKVPVVDWFVLPAGWWKSFAFGRLFTYLFVHASLMHLLSNMIGLFFIGPVVERTIGSYRFFILYYVSGILGGLGWSLLAQPGSLCVGASGGVIGILGAFGALYPHDKLLLWFFIPIRAWLLVLFLMFWELSEIIGEPKIGGIANTAHLIGGIAGVCYALSLKHPNFFSKLQKRFVRSAPLRSAFRPERFSKEEIDRILDKIGKEGMGALSPCEREMLKRATRR